MKSVWRRGQAPTGWVYLSVFLTVCIVTFLAVVMNDRPGDIEVVDRWIREVKEDWETLAAENPELQTVVFQSAAEDNGTLLVGYMSMSDEAVWTLRQFLDQHVPPRPVVFAEWTPGTHVPHLHGQ